MSATVHRPFDSHAQQWRFAIAETGVTSDWMLRLDADYMVEPALRDEIAALAPDAGDGGLRDRLHLLHRRQAAAGLALSRAARPVPARPRAFVQDGHTEKLRIDGPVDAARQPPAARRPQEPRALAAEPVALSGRRGREARLAAVVGTELGRPAALHARAGADRRRGALPVREGSDIRRHGRSSSIQPSA